MAERNVNNSSATGAVNENCSRADMALSLQNSDNPSMSLVTKPLNEVNYMLWCKSVKMALSSKDKLGYINGLIPELEPTDPNYGQWKRVDSMVNSWILNSISPELRDQFMYCTSSKNLWDELLQIFGICNGPMIYDLKKEISDLSQGSLSVMVYYSKLKKYWEELNVL